MSSDSKIDCETICVSVAVLQPAFSVLGSDPMATTSVPPALASVGYCPSGPPEAGFAAAAGAAAGAACAGAAGAVVGAACAGGAFGAAAFGAAVGAAGGGAAAGADCCAGGAHASSS